VRLTHAIPADRVAIVARRFVVGQIVDFPSNGKSAQGYLALPEGSGPGVVVIQEWWGLNGHIKDVADRFAAEGFVALAPDLYHGTVTKEPDEAGKLMMEMNLETAARDLSGSFDFLTGHESVQPKKIGATGFCMGGGMALFLATLKPIAATVPFYGVGRAQADFSKLSGPVLGHYAQDDASLPPEKYGAGTRPDRRRISAPRSSASIAFARTSVRVSCQTTAL